MFYTVCNDQGNGPPVPIGTHVMVRLQSAPAVPKMRWMWAVYVIMTKRERAARRAIAAATFRVARLRDRTTKLVRNQYLYVHITLRPR